LLNYIFKTILSGHCPLSRDPTLYYPPTLLSLPRYRTHVTPLWIDYYTYIIYKHFLPCRSDVNIPNYRCQNNFITWPTNLSAIFDRESFVFWPFKSN